MVKVITIKNWRRPDLYEKCLNSLAQCDGIEEYTIINCVDPQGKYPKFFERIDRTHPINRKTLPIITHVAKTLLGCAGNTRKAFQLGFAEKTDFVIHVEDDMILARDFLRYMEWANERFHEDPDIFVAVGWNRRTEMITEERFMKQLPMTGVRLPLKTYQAFGLWRRIWDEVKDGWFGIHWAFDEPKVVPEGDEFLKFIKKSDDGSWGWPMLKYWRRGRYEVYPYISRCQNIGDTRGRFNWTPQWHYQHVHTRIFAEDKVPTEEYRVEFDDRSTDNGS